VANPILNLLVQGGRSRALALALLRHRAPFIDPSSIPSLAAWWDFSSLGLADGTAISSVTDRSGHGNAATQVTGTKQPLFKTSIQNGLGVARFDGTDDVLSTSVVNNVATRTVFIVAVQAAATTSRTLWCPLDNSNAKVGDEGGVWGYFANQVGAAVSLGSATTTWSIVTVRYNATTSADGFVNRGTPTNFNPDDVYQTGGGSFEIGAHSAAGGEPWNGDIGEMLVYDTALGESDRQAVEDWLYNKWFVSTGPNSFVVTATDSITFADTATRALSETRSPTDSITLSESLTRSSSSTRTTADSATFAESVGGLNGKTRASSDSVSLVEALARTAQAFPRASTDSLTFSEALTRTGSATRTRADSMTFSESVLGSQGKTRTTADAFAFSESLTRSVLGYGRTASDSLTFSEAPSRTLSSARALSDSVTFSESITSGKAISRTGTDTLTFSESLTRSAGHPRTPVDQVSFSESLARTQALTGRTSSDTLSFSESHTVAKGISRTLADSATFAESLACSIGRVRSASDNFTLSDALTRGAQPLTGRAGVDSVTFAEVLSSTASTEPSTRWIMGPSGRWPGLNGARWPGDTSPRWDGANGTRWPSPVVTTRWP
jgi:hypothetical protein